ncbi:MAG: hypothetical protein BMS9Abin17_0759 [Acidimicrobiia bacterium]|nr:MAG: hypothetical protein BMS9Abin17_0759 [Acidimicrobiia bacterium]
MNGRKQIIAGIALILIGIVVTIAASVVVHMAESPRFDSLGRELFPAVPRSWQLVTLAQLVALGGVLMSMAGATYGFLWQLPLTWARAMLGALLFSGLMFIIFAIIPNEFLTLTQATLEWTPQKTLVAVPPILALNNEISVSLAVLKDMISAGYATVMLIVIPVIMYKWQVRATTKDAPKPTPISAYGRPMKVDS